MYRKSFDKFPLMQFCEFTFKKPYGNFKKNVWWTIMRNFYWILEIEVFSGHFLFISGKHFEFKICYKFYVFDIFLRWTNSYRYKCSQSWDLLYKIFFMLLLFIRKIVYLKLDKIYLPAAKTKRLSRSRQISHTKWPPEDRFYFNRRFHRFQFSDITRKGS